MTDEDDLMCGMRASMEREIAKAVDAELDACAKIAREAQYWCRSFGPEGTAAEIEKLILERRYANPHGQPQHRISRP